MNNPFVQSAGIVRFLLLAMLLPVLAGCASIHKAANKGDMAGVKAFLLKGTDVDARDAYGRTPLMYVLSNLDHVRFLVGQGADVNARDELGETPLMKAAWVGQLDVVKFLVEKGADVNAVDKNGETLLLKATSSGRLSVVQYLMKKGAAVESGAAGDSGR